MKGTYLGEFEEIVLLAIGILAGDAYGVTIQKEIENNLGRTTTLSALHTAMHRLEKKGYLKSYLGGATNERGGKRKRIFELTNLGRTALEMARASRETMWQLMPKPSTND